MDFHLARIWTHILIPISSVFFFTSLQNCQTHVMAASMGTPSLKTFMLYVCAALILLEIKSILLILALLLYVLEV